MLSGLELESKRATPKAAHAVEGSSHGIAKRPATPGAAWLIAARQRDDKRAD